LLLVYWFRLHAAARSFTRVVAAALLGRGGVPKNPRQKREWQCPFGHCDSSRSGANLTLAPGMEHVATFNLYVDRPRGDTTWMIETSPANNVFRGVTNRVR